MALVAALALQPPQATPIMLSGAIHTNDAVPLFDVTIAPAAKVALFEGCNYQGRATVLGANHADLLQWNGDTVVLDRLGVSIWRGDNTGLLIDPRAGFIGMPTTIMADQACLAQPAVAASVERQPRYLNIWRIL